jgi:hypothetical protein
MYARCITQSNPHRYAYTFQTYAFLSRMRAQMRPPTYFSQYNMGPTVAAARAATPDVVAYVTV